MPSKSTAQKVLLARIENLLIRLEENEQGLMEMRDRIQKLDSELDKSRGLSLFEKCRHFVSCGNVEVYHEGNKQQLGKEIK